MTRAQQMAVFQVDLVMITYDDDAKDVVVSTHDVYDSMKQSSIFNAVSCDALNCSRCPQICVL
jgi:hypothetical protein